MLWNKRSYLLRCLEKEGIRNYNKSTYGILVSRFDFQFPNLFNRLGIFIIPRKNETAEQALLHYLPLIRGLSCDVFVFNRPKTGKTITKRKAIACYKALLDSYQLFVLKTNYLDDIVIITDISMAPIALSLSTQVPNIGVIVDSTRKRRKYKKWHKFFERIQSFSFVNLWVSITRKNDDLLRKKSKEISDIVPPIMLITLKEPKIKRIFRYQLFNVKMLKAKVFETALRIKKVEYDEEFKNSIQLFLDTLSKNKFNLLHN